MCGIIGVISQGNAVEKVVNGLEKNLYRGYDSVGVASITPEGLDVRKGTGKVEENKESLLSVEGKTALGHNRWATTGMVTRENAHPQTDCSGKIAVVHNGIIENFNELKSLVEGHKLHGETDTEIIPHLIEKFMSLGFKEAVRKTFSLLKGRNAFVALNSSGEMIGVRKGSPLIVGVGKGDVFIASDVPAFLEHTREVMYLDDNEMVSLGEKLEFFSAETGAPVDKRIVTIEWDASQTDKGDYPHFLIKEIMEQKETVVRAINQDDGEIQGIANRINSAYGTFFIGCGTAGKVCQVGEYLFNTIAKKHVNYFVASEFPYYEHFLTPNTQVVAVSQSGETADVLDAIEAAKKKGSKIISLVNVRGSSLDRISDHSFLINAGPEKAVASTKVTTSQIALLTLLAYASAGKLKQGKLLLLDTASKVNDMLNPRYDYHIKNLAEKIHKQSNIFIIGRGLNYPIALESAIKIMEVSQMHAQGFAGGELKHYSLALISKGTPCIVIVPEDETKGHILSNASEVKARGGYIIGVSPKKHEIFDHWVKVPDSGNASPIVNIIPMQILAYHLGVLRGCDPDYCNNLSKSVTVR